MHLRTSCVCLLAALFSVLPAVGQQNYVSQFDAYIGYAYLNSPAVSLAENGFQFQTGVRVRRWVSLGFDYSRSSGNLTLMPSELTPALQQELGAELAQLVAAGQIPANYVLVVPATSTTQTFAAGPQLAWRRWAHMTIFARPSIGMIRERAVPKPGDPIAAAVAEQLAPSGSKLDWTEFYGFGGGVDLIFSKHVAVRVQADFVHDHLFSDLLADGRNTVRFSIGPCFNLGKNVPK